MYLNRQNIITLLLAFTLWLLFISIPWELLRGKEYRDVLQYIQNINMIRNYGFDVLYQKDSLIAMISQEALWGYLLGIIGELPVDPKLALFCISSFSFFTISYFTFKNSDHLIAFFILCNPLMITFVYDQVRSSFAFSIILIALLSKKKHLLIFLMCLSLFIHTAMTIVIFGLLLANFVIKFRPENILVKKLIVVLVALLISFILTHALSIILGAIGDRRAEYTDIQSTKLFGSFWYLALVIVAFSKELSRQTLFMIFLLSLFTFNTLMGGYGARFLAMLLPFFAITLSNIERNHMKLIFILYIYNTFILWLFYFQNNYWLNN